jgi:predicted ATPase
LILLSDRLTNHEIVTHLHLAESTVKDFVGKILSKLYVNNRRQAVEQAKILGLLNGGQQTRVGVLTNLLVEPTTFVGRKNELKEIKRYLLGTRLLTQTGQGGIGKTRLALKTAVETAEFFEDGSFFVPLAPIRSIESIIQTIAEAIKFPLATSEDPQNQLLGYLRNRQLLMVMDNFEHLLEGVGIITKILDGAPKVKILVTSRERLNLLRETVLHVGGMTFPNIVHPADKLEYDAVTLFVQRANKVRPGFELSPDELPQIGKI